MYIAGGWLLPGRKRLVPYSIQTLKRLKPTWFRQDLIALFDLLREQKIKPLIAERFPLAEASQAHEMLGNGGVTGKIVLVSNLDSIPGASIQPLNITPVSAWRDLVHPAPERRRRGAGWTGA